MARHAQPFVALCVFATAILFCLSGGCGSNKNNGALSALTMAAAAPRGGVGFGASSSGGSSSGGGSGSGSGFIIDWRRRRRCRRRRDLPRRVTPELLRQHEVRQPHDDHR